MTLMQTVEVTGSPNVYPGYVNFSLRAMVPETESPCGINLEAYDQNRRSLRLIPAIRPRERLDSQWLEHILEQGVDQGYVTWDDLAQLQDYLHAHSARVLDAEGADSARAHMVVYENALCTIKSAMLDSRNGRRLSLGMNRVRQVIDLCYQDSRIRNGLLKVMVRDRTIFNHSLNTCLLAVGFATAQGWSHDECGELGGALLFHDLGLAGPEESDSNGKPAQTGSQAYADHPQLSRELMVQVPGATEAMLDLVLNHHENLDGSGFPRGLSAADLGPGDRLARITDLYESLTSGCFGDPQVSAYQALAKMRREMAQALDQDMLEKFVRFLGQI